MVTPLIALLPTIFGALQKAPALIATAREVIETVTGKETPPASSTADLPALQAQVDAMTPEQQERFAALMQGELDKYRAETERQDHDQGELTPEILQVLGDKADDVAEYRMLTRPKIVRLMAWVLLLPIGVLLADAAFILLNSLLAMALLAAGVADVYQLPLLAETLFREGSIYADLYGQVVWPATLIVLGYFGIHTMEKLKGADAGATPLLESVTGLFRKVTGRAR